MLRFYSNVSYNVPGDTYFAENSGKYYLLYTEYLNSENCYEITPMEEVDMPAIHRSKVGQPLYADTYEEVIEIIENYINNFE